MNGLALGDRTGGGRAGHVDITRKGKQENCYSSVDCGGSADLW